MAIELPAGRVRKLSSLQPDPAIPYTKPAAQLFLEEHIRHGGLTINGLDILQRMVKMIGALSRLVFPPHKPLPILNAEIETDLDVIATVKWLAQCLIQGCEYWGKVIGSRLLKAKRARDGLPDLYYPDNADRARVYEDLKVWAMTLKELHTVTGNEIKMFRLIYAHFQDSVWSRFLSLHSTEPDHPLCNFHCWFGPISVGLSSLVALCKEADGVVTSLDNEHDHCFNRFQIDVPARYKMRTLSALAPFTYAYGRMLNAKAEAKQEAKERLNIMLTELPTIARTDDDSQLASVPLSPAPSNSSVFTSFGTLVANFDHATEPPRASLPTNTYPADVSSDFTLNNHAKRSEDPSHDDRVCLSQDSHLQMRSFDSCTTEESSNTLATESHLYEGLPHGRNSIQPDQPIPFVQTSNEAPTADRQCNDSGDQVEADYVLAPTRSADPRAVMSTRRANLKDMPRIITGSFSEIENKLSSLRPEGNRQISICSPGSSFPDAKIRVRDFATAPTSPEHSTLPSPATLLKRSNAVSCDQFDWEQRILKGEIVRYRRPSKGKDQAKPIDDRGIEIEEWLRQPRAGERAYGSPALHRQNTI